MNQKPDSFEAPMGVSQWREHGKKYGYWDYYINSAVDERVAEARIDENQMYLDRINNYIPDPNAPRFGSASGAMEVQGFKDAFEDRIAELKGTQQ